MKKKTTFPTFLQTIYLLCFFHLLSLSSFQGFAINNSDTLLASNNYKLAKAKVDLGQLDSAIYYFEKSAQIYKELDLYEKHTACLNNISEQNFYLGRLEKADIYAYQALQIGLTHNLNHQIGKSYNSIAATFNQRGMLDSASVYFEKALSIWLPLDGEQHLRIVVIYTNLGVMYQALGDYKKSFDYSNRAVIISNSLDEDMDEYLAYNYNTLGAISVAKGLYAEAISYFEEALQLWLAKYGEAHFGVATFRMNMGEIYRRKGDFEQALLYYNKTLSTFKQLGIEIHQYVGSCYTNIGSVFSEMRDYDSALSAFLKAQEIWTAIGDHHYSLAVVNNNISQVYLYSHNYDTAIIYLEKAINILKNGFPTSHPDLGLYYFNLGKCYSLKKDYDKARDYYEIAAELLLSSMGEKHPNLAACYRFQGQLCLAQKQNIKAAEYFQRAIIADIQGFENTNIYANPGLKNILSKTYLVSVLEDKAQTFYKLFGEHPDSLRFLETALQTGELAIRLLDIIRTDYKSDGSKFFLNKEFASVFTGALNYSIELYQITGNNNYYLKAFDIAEKSKSAVLFSSIIDLDAKTIGGIPDSLQRAARLLKHDISFYDQKIKEENEKEKPDMNKTDKWQNIYFDCVKNYDNLIASFEKDYPDYYDLKYNLNVAGINDVQSNLSKDDALIEYMLTDTTMVTFLITKHRANIYSTPIDSSFMKQVNEFRELIISKDFSDESVRRYCEVAHQLHLQLISPFEELIEGMALIIIPDGKLATIPFEALLTSSVQGRDWNSKNYPYFIKQYPVSYGYSSTIMLNSLKRKMDAAHHSILSFAPSFQADDKELLAELKDRGAEFVSLPGAKEEVLQIMKIVGNGKLFVDEEATESNFKHQSPDYKILHIATHGIFDDKNPMMSRLVFSKTNDSIDDGLLNVYELYSLSLNADMAVLSSCNSGYGKLQQGEGVMSMARAFLYAGVPGIVMSQWSINDKSSKKIMSYFYEYLNNGLSKARALQKAKMNYLQNADGLTANPYFWAGFVVIGNPLPVLFSTGVWDWWLLIVPALLLGWILFRKKYKTR